MADTSYAVPVYRTWPDKPYVVLGSLKFSDPNASWNDGDIRQVAKEAKKRGGTAIILRYGAESAVFGFTAESIPLGGFVMSSQPTSLVIRFKTAEELRLEEEQQQSVFACFRQKFFANLEQNLGSSPPATFSEDTARLAVKFLLQSGLGLRDRTFAERFGEVMMRVSAERENSLSGEWLYKIDYESSTLTGSDTKSAFGLAALQSDEKGIVIVSKEGGAELNFSGTADGGRISGQLGVYRISGNAEGALLNDKISLTLTTATRSGTVRCTVVFQRVALPRRLFLPRQDSDPTIKKT